MSTYIGIAPALSVWVSGTPAPQGSLKAFVRGKRAIITSANKHTMPWRATVRQQLIDAGHGRELLDSPVRIVMEFYMPRPKGHYGKKGLRMSAPPYPTVKPDLDKLERAVLDALTGVVLWDDARVVEIHSKKRWAEWSPTCQPGLTLTIEPLPVNGSSKWADLPRRLPDGSAAVSGGEQR